MMPPWWSSDNGETRLELFQGHALDVLRILPDASVHAIVTSPPYWGLRDYGLPPQVWDGDPICAHQWGQDLRGPSNMAGGGSARSTLVGTHPDEVKGVGTLHDGGTSAFCERCGAWRGSLGLEPAPALYVAHLVQVFRMARRVLRPDGTLWVNLGDSYASAAGMAAEHGPTVGNRAPAMPRTNRLVGDLKEKDLIGAPWELAFALRSEGWYLRSAIIWAKGLSFCPDYSGSVMPESVTDRPTSSYETLFLLSPGPRYYYDQDAVREKSVTAPDPKIPTGWEVGNGAHGTLRPYRSVRDDPHIRGRRQAPHPSEPQAFHPGGRNLRNVWAINPEPFDEAHFATFPQGLVVPVVQLATPEGGTVLDPFAGAGTTLLVARRLGRHGIGIELSEAYCRIARARIGPHTQMALIAGGRGLPSGGI